MDGSTKVKQEGIHPGYAFSGEKLNVVFQRKWEMSKDPEGFG